MVIVYLIFAKLKYLFVDAAVCLVCEIFGFPDIYKSAADFCNLVYRLFEFVESFVGGVK